MTTTAELAFVIGVAAAAGYDLARRRVPNALNLAILVGGVAARAAAGGLGSAGLGVAGAALGLALLVPLFAARWIGGGDVKLAAALGAWLGPSAILPALLVGLAGGGVVAAAIAVRSAPEAFANARAALWAMSAPAAPRRRRAQLVPLALPLGAAALVVFFGGLHA